MRIVKYFADKNNLKIVAINTSDISKGFYLVDNTNHIIISFETNSGNFAITYKWLITNDGNAEFCDSIDLKFLNQLNLNPKNPSILK